MPLLRYLHFAGEFCRHEVCALRAPAGADCMDAATANATRGQTRIHGAEIHG
jgi:hypothetical protein